MLNNTVDNVEQCGQHNIVQSRFHQPWTGCAFLRVYIGYSVLIYVFWLDYLTVLFMEKGEYLQHFIDNPPPARNLNK